jgi:MoxR-like ATPase
MNLQETIPAEAGKVAQLIGNVEKIIRGKREEIVKVITCLVAGGHVLIEDLPGSGKTSLAKSLALSIGGNATPADGRAVSAVFKRIQFTPDLLPMDLIGTFIFDESKKDFFFKKGPLFANIVLGDEINRASPKVQSALLECMAERQITAGEQTFALDRVFFVIATQNPIEMEGTYPLPAAQLDRFFMKISFGYVEEQFELEILNDYLRINKITESIHPILSIQDIETLQKSAEQVYIHPEIVKSVAHIVRATRIDPAIIVGASTRSGIYLLMCLKAFALIQGRNYVIEDDLKSLTHPVLQHRLVCSSIEAQKNALNDILVKEVMRLDQVKPAFAVSSSN